MSRNWESERNREWRWWKSSEGCAHPASGRFAHAHFSLPQHPLSLPGRSLALCRTPLCPAASSHVETYGCHSLSGYSELVPVLRKMFKNPLSTWWVQGTLHISRFPCLFAFFTRNSHRCDDSIGLLISKEGIHLLGRDPREFWSMERVSAGGEEKDREHRTVWYLGREMGGGGQENEEAPCP